jgi:hypothetical protein
MNYKRNSELGSCNNWCRRKAISITSHFGLNHPADNAHAPNRIVIYGLSGCTIFSHVIS